MTGGDRRPPVEQVFDHAAEQIVAAANELWPGGPVRLGEHVPSVTSYVRRISVGSQVLYAKYDLLGSTLVSVLHGLHGEWPRVLNAQRGYVRRRDGLLVREAEQLRIFSYGGQLNVSKVAGYRNGVLFTEDETAGVALDEALLVEPRWAPELLRQAWTPLTRPYRTPVEGWPTLAERSIGATFGRLFLGSQRGTVHLRRQVRSGVPLEVVEGLEFVLRRLPSLPAIQRTRLVFGGAEPEHIRVTGGAPVYLSPNVHVGSALSDLGTLVSRLLLMVITRVPETRAVRQIMGGLNNLVLEEQAAAASGAPPATWMAELLTLVAQDATSTITNYVTAPAQLPLPTTAKDVLRLAAVVVPVIEHIVTGLVQRRSPTEIWEQTVEDVVES